MRDKVLSSASFCVLVGAIGVTYALMRLRARLTVLQTENRRLNLALDVQDNTISSLMGVKGEHVHHA